MITGGSGGHGANAQVRWEQCVSGVGARASYIHFGASREVCEDVERQEVGGISELAGEAWSTGGLTRRDRQEAGNSQQDVIS